MDHHFEETLEALKKSHQYRKCTTVVPSGEASTTATINDRECILFCSNDYLGLSHDPRLQEAATQTMKDYGIGTGASRLISGTTPWHARLEERITQFKQKEAALVYSSGFLANIGIISALTGKKDLIVIDKLNHASIIDACRLSEATLRVYPHKNMSKLEHVLSSADKYKTTLVVTDSVFSMDGDCAPLREMIQLKKKYNALLMIDEAHATGIFGNRGSGLAEELACEADVDIAMGTLSKACGVLGGYAAASKVLVDFLKNKSRSFIYTTSMPAHLCAACCEAINIIEADSHARHRVLGSTQQIRHALHDIGFTLTDGTAPIIGVIIGNDEAALNVAKYLFGQGLYIPAIRPPTVPRGTARLRITVSAAHTHEHIEQLIAAMRACYRHFFEKEKT